MPNATHPRSQSKGGSPDFNCFQMSSVPATAFPTSQISAFATRNLDKSGYQSDLLKIKWRRLCELWVTYRIEPNPQGEGNKKKSLAYKSCLVICHSVLSTPTRFEEIWKLDAQDITRKQHLFLFIAAEGGLPGLQFCTSVSDTKDPW